MSGTGNDGGFFGLGGVGYVLRGKSAWGEHVMAADNDGRLRDSAGWLVTAAYDGELQRYWFELVPGIGGFYGAKTGEFTVDDASYYGTADEGYVARNFTGWIESNYGSFNNDGVFTAINNDYTNVVHAFVNWMVNIAADASHGYDQTYRWGELGDYDCSSLVVSALRAAGINTYGATYTGNMRSQLTRGSFAWITDLSSRQYGDILLNEGNHTAIYLGDGTLVQATINEKGTATGGTPGDQTGREISIRDYYSYPWNGILRYV